MIRTITAAVVNALGDMRSLIAKREPRREVTEEQVKDAAQLARLLRDLTREVVELERRPCPRRIDFEDMALGSNGARLPLSHKFGGRVRWWVVDQVDDYAALKLDTDATTTDVLVLISDVECVATIRVEEVGG